MSSNQILRFLVSTCYFNSVIQSVNTVIVLLFCYLPVIILYTGILLCYSAIYRYYAICRYYALLLFHSLLHLSQCCWALILSHTIPYWYLFIIHLLLKIDIAFIYSTVHNV